MKERPILFSAPMVRAILDGTKTQTRRTFKGSMHDLSMWVADQSSGTTASKARCPYGQSGDQLWVRETWQGYHRVSYETDEWEEMDSPKDRHEKPYSPVYRADNKNFPGKWFPAIHMPREFSRILLEVVSVRVERLQDISDADAIVEGIERIGGATSCCPWRNYRIGNSGEMNMHCSAPSRSYMTLWESINGPGSWDANPWVWVVEFKRLTP